MGSMVISISGKAGSGKTMYGRLLLLLLLAGHNKSARAFGFADTLKEVASRAYGVPFNHFYSREHKDVPCTPTLVPAWHTGKTVYTIPVIGGENDISVPTLQVIEKMPTTPREIMLLLGADGGVFPANLWRRCLLEKLNAYFKQELGYDKYAIIHDARYKDELRTLQLFSNHYDNCKCVKFKINPHTNTPGTSHPEARSETNLDDLPDDYFDVVFSPRKGRDGVYETLAQMAAYIGFPVPESMYEEHLQYIAP